jgi:hypothetical protein
VIGKDRPDKDNNIVILTKFVVTPDEALDFIEAVKKVKDAAQDGDGNELYSLVKTKVCLAFSLSCELSPLIDCESS